MVFQQKSNYLRCDVSVDVMERDITKNLTLIIGSGIEKEDRK